jgi:hypothetical protein
MMRTFHVLAVLAAFLCGAGQAKANVVNYAVTATNQFGTVDLQTGVFTNLGTLGVTISGGIIGDIDRLPGGPLFGNDVASDLWRRLRCRAM